MKQENIKYKQVIKWGGDDAPVVMWSLDPCRASSETDPYFYRSVLLYKQIRR